MKQCGLLQFFTLAETMSTGDRQVSYPELSRTWAQLIPFMDYAALTLTSLFAVDYSAPPLYPSTISRVVLIGPNIAGYFLDCSFVNYHSLV